MHKIIKLLQFKSELICMYIVNAYGGDGGSRCFHKAGILAESAQRFIAQQRFSRVN